MATRVSKSIDKERTDVIVGSLFVHFGISEPFFETNEWKNCISSKEDRPYTMTIVMVNALYFSIPLRSDIKHDHVVWSNEANKCGLDLSSQL